MGLFANPDEAAKKLILISHIVVELGRPKKGVQGSEMVGTILNAAH